MNFQPSLFLPPPPENNIFQPQPQHQNHQRESMSIANQDKGQSSNIQNLSCQNMLEEADIGHYNSKNFGGLSDEKIIKLLKNFQCPICKRKSLEYYCIDQSCKEPSLICPKCEEKDIHSKHFAHVYSYALPLFNKDIININENHETIVKEIRVLLTKHIDDLQANVASLKDIVNRIDKDLNAINDYKLSTLEKLTKNVKEISHQKIFYEVPNIFNSHKFQSHTKIFQELAIQIQSSMQKIAFPNFSKNIFSSKAKQLKEVPQKILFKQSDKLVKISGFTKKGEEDAKYFLNDYHEYGVDLTSEVVATLGTRINRFKNCSKLTLQTSNLLSMIEPLSFASLKRMQFVHHIHQNNKSHQNKGSPEITEQEKQILYLNPNMPLTINSNLKSLSLQDINLSELTFLTKFLTNKVILSELSVSFSDPPSTSYSSYYSSTSSFGGYSSSSYRILFEFLRVLTTKRLTSLNLVAPSNQWSIPNGQMMDQLCLILDEIHNLSYFSFDKFTVSEESKQRLLKALRQKPYLIYSSIGDINLKTMCMKRSRMVHIIARNYKTKLVGNDVLFRMISRIYLNQHDNCS